MTGTRKDFGLGAVEVVAIATRAARRGEMQAISGIAETYRHHAANTARAVQQLAESGRSDEAINTALRELLAFSVRMEALERLTEHFISEISREGV
jgi:hypothetical protein